MHLNNSIAKCRKLKTAQNTAKHCRALQSTAQHCKALQRNKESEIQKQRLQTGSQRASTALDCPEVASRLQWHAKSEDGGCSQGLWIRSDRSHMTSVPWWIAHHPGMILRIIVTSANWLQTCLQRMSKIHPDITRMLEQEQWQQKLTTDRRNSGQKTRLSD